MHVRELLIALTHEPQTLTLCQNSSGFVNILVPLEVPLFQELLSVIHVFCRDSAAQLNAIFVFNN